MLPKAPNPITTARARASSRWPLTPISGRTSCRRYRLDESTRHERMADLWPFARPPLLPGSLRSNRSDAVDCEECAQADRAPSCRSSCALAMMSNGDHNGFHGVYGTVRVAHDGERTRPACQDFTILTILTLVLVVVSLLSGSGRGSWISGLSSQL